MTTTGNDEWTHSSGTNGADPVASDAGTTGWQANGAAETVAVVAVVAVGTAIIEAALIPGMILGVATMLVPKVLPSLGGGLQPMFRATVRGAYHFGRKTRHILAEAQEQVQDVVAEAQAETTAKTQ